MMAINSTQRGGANAGRGDVPHPTNPHGLLQSVADQHAKQMGVPSQWVTGAGTARFTGSIVGHDKGNVWFSAESTGGGATDSHQIPFTHPSMGEKWRFDKQFGVNNDNPSAGKKWVAEGKHVRQGIRADSPWGMHWTLTPAKEGE